MTGREKNKVLNQVVKYLLESKFQNVDGEYVRQIFEDTKIIVRLDGDSIRIDSYIKMPGDILGIVSRRVDLLRLQHNVIPCLRNEFREIIASQVDYLFNTYPQIKS